MHTPATSSDCVANWRSLSICPCGMPLFTSKTALRPDSCNFKSFSASCIPARPASQNGELPLVRRMIRFSPPEPELEQPKGAMPTARPIRNKHLGSQRIVEYLRKASAHQEMLEANKTRAV